MEYDEMLKNLKDTQKITETSVSKLSKETKEILHKLAEIEVLKVEVRSLQEKVNTLEKGKNWLYKSIIGAIFLAILGIFMQFRTSIKSMEIRKEVIHQIHLLDKQVAEVDKTIEKKYPEEEKADRR